MCAILGFSGFVPEGRWGETHAILRELFLASEHRGRDASGFATVTEPLDAPLSGRFVATKEPLPATRFIAGNSAFRRLAHQRCACFVGHVRAATHGSPADNANNHPFVVGTWALVHNGIVTNYRDIAEDHGLRLTTQCDSEVLARLVEHHADPALGLDVALREVSGSMAVAVLDTATGSVWLARNGGRPLWLAQMRGDRRWFFASTAPILLRAFTRVLGESVRNRLSYFAPVPQNCVVSLRSNGAVLAATVTVDTAI